MLSSLEKREQSILHRNLQMGICLASDYSGTGQAEKTLAELSRFAIEHFAWPGPFPKCNIRACDINPICREVLMEADQSTCVMGDMCGRLPFTLQDEVRKLIERYHGELSSSLSQEGTRERMILQINERGIYSCVKKTKLIVQIK